MHPGLLVTIPRDRLVGGLSNISPQLLLFPKTWPKSVGMSEEPISDTTKSLAGLKLGEGTVTDGVPEDFAYEPTPSELNELLTEDGMVFIASLCHRILYILL